MFVTNAPLLSPIEIERLISQQTISDLYPWATADDDLIEGHIKGACAAVIRATGAKSKVQWNHYGSGYASYVDAWFYKATPEFNVLRPIGQGEEHTGLIILFSRLSPYYAFMEGEKHWEAHTASSYLPEFHMVDQLKSPGVIELVRLVSPILENQGFIRARKEQLTEPLPSTCQVPTVLNDRGFSQFDALFYWED